MKAFTKRIGRLGFALVLVFSLPAFQLGAQDESQAAQTAPIGRATGDVRTSSGVPVPGANLRLVETSTGRAWVSWTDENGHFDLPGLPLGHYRIEVSQLGFDNVTQEFDLGETPGTIRVTLKVASLAAIEAAASPAQDPNKMPEAAGTPPSAATANAGAGDNSETPGQGRGGGGLRRRQFPGGGGAPGTGTGQNGQNGAAAQGGAAPGAGGPGPGGQGLGGRRGGFQQVILNNQNGGEGQEGANGQEAQGAGAGEPGPLGQASASDAILMNGTVGQGDQNAGFGGGGFPPGGVFLQGAGDAGQSGFGGTGGGFRGGAPSANPGGAGTPGLQGGGRWPGGPAIAFRGAGGGRGGPGGRGAPPQGVTALYGMQRVLRQRINRIRASFYNEYSNSVFNARPYSLTQPNAPKIPAWNERIGGNLGGPLVIPHIYDGHDKTFFFVNFDGTWARNAVDQFSTVPTLFERQNLGNFCDRGPQPQLYVANPADLAGPRQPVWLQHFLSREWRLNTTVLGLLQFHSSAESSGLSG